MRNLLVMVLALGMAQAFAGNINIAKSQLNWLGKKKIVSDEHKGTIKIKDGNVTLTKAGKLQKAEVVVDMNSIVVTDISDPDWNKKFVGHMQSDDFFNTAKFPTAKIVIENVKGNKATGKLTIKGKTAPVSFNVKQNGKSFSGTLKFDRTKYGIVYGSNNFFKDLVAKRVIDEEIKLDFNVVTK